MPGKVLIEGVGDCGSAIAHRLFQAGYIVVIHDVAEPAVSRRTMAFADAVIDGEATLEGIRARRISIEELAPGGPRRDFIPIVAGGTIEEVIATFQPDVLVNASMRKREIPPPWKGLAPLTIGLGPNFVAGKTTDVVVETSWEDLGRIIHEGAALPLRGEPRSIDGHARDRFVYAPASGIFRSTHQIGDLVERGQAIGTIDGVVLQAPLAGALRALTRDGVAVAAGTKVAEVDPRGAVAVTGGIGERPGRLSESVATVVCDWEAAGRGRPPRRHASLLSAVFGVPIGTLGGLIGLGGAEFRLPVLTGPLRLAAHDAVSINLLISLATIAAAFAIRSGTLSAASIGDHAWETAGLAASATIAAFVTAGLVRRVTDRSLRLAILLLLAAIGCLLLAESVAGESGARAAPGGAGWSLVVGFVLGAGIGAVSSLLGVAGGELLIPTFVFIFGADIKTAGTASLLVSVPMVATGVARYARSGAYRSRATLQRVALPMAIASVAGAAIGGALASVAPGQLLKLLLGLALLSSAAHMWAKLRHATDEHSRERQAAPSSR